MLDQIFRGKSALVTGAAAGIGYATAKMFAEAGASVALIDANGEAVSKAAESMVAAGHHAVALECDVSNEGQVEQVLGRAVSIFGRLDVACNNAGIHVAAVEMADATGTDFDHLMSINLRGVWNCMKYELTQMRQQGEGSIVNVSSTNGLIGNPGLGAYTASKHGVIGLTRSAALDYASKGIRVNAVCPGAVHTPMIERAIAAYPDAMKTVIESIPLGRFGRPEEIASAVLWLSSPQASFAIGSVVVIDGGYTAR
jgi:NAD(P)-dependent dehydrogenase (short-subunit alcohol dehydrogenase family)